MQFPIGDKERPIVDQLGHYPLRPKQEIGLYMASVGFRVPEIFDDRQAAEESGAPYYARSENPGEMTGYSGLTHSIPVHSQHTRELVEVIDSALHDPDRSYSSLTDPRLIAGLGYDAEVADFWKTHVRLGFKHTESWRRVMARDGLLDDGPDATDEFARAHDLSYWRLHEGINFYVVGDSGRAGRYYIGQWPAAHASNRQRFSIVENGKLQHDSSLGEPLPLDTDKLIEFYENVRRTPIVAEGNVPIVEGVDDGTERPLFVQMLPTQQQIQEPHSLGYPPIKDRLIRGATSPEGIELAVYGDDAATRDHDIAFGHVALAGWSHGENEYLLGRSQFNVQVFANRNLNPIDHLGHGSIGHNMRSELLKPGITVALPPSVAFKLRDCDVVHVRSDGDRIELQYYDQETGRIAQMAW